MTEKDLPQGFFPDAGTVPTAYVMSPHIKRRYRIGGQILEWSGPIRAVVSPVYVNVEHQFLGSCPSLTETESLAA